MRDWAGAAFARTRAYPATPAFWRTRLRCDAAESRTSFISKLEACSTAALHQLSTGRGDVGAERIARRHFETCGAEGRGELTAAWLGRADKSGVDRVIGNQIDMRRNVRQKADQCLSI